MMRRMAWVALAMMVAACSGGGGNSSGGNNIVAGDLPLGAPSGTPTPSPSPSATVMGEGGGDASQATTSEMGSTDDYGSPTDQPSFSCAGQLSNVENIICHDRYLATLDNNLTHLYNERRNGADEETRAELLDGQRDFLTARAQCADAACIAAAYLDRIGQLDEDAD